MSKHEMFCDDCGETLNNWPSDAYIVESLPSAITSANEGESAILCEDCHSIIMEDINND